MTNKTHQKIAKETPAGQTAYELMLEIAQVFFLMRQAGQQIDAVTPAGAGSWGLMRSLKEKGPQTVPQLAKARPVSRQHIQKLANELADQGLVAFVENPGHKSSHLLTLTKKGEKHFAATDRKVRQYIGRLSAGIDPEALAKTKETLRILREKLKAGTGKTPS